MSRYTPIWEELKVKRVIALAVPPQLHRRVIKAVIRTKDEDVAFKFQAAEEHRKYTLEYKIEQAKITFTLKCELKLSALGV